MDYVTENSKLTRDDVSRLSKLCVELFETFVAINRQSKLGTELARIGDLENAAFTSMGCLKACLKGLAIVVELGIEIRQKLTPGNRLVFAESIARSELERPAAIPIDIGCCFDAAECISRQLPAELERQFQAFGWKIEGDPYLNPDTYRSMESTADESFSTSAGEACEAINNATSQLKISASDAVVLQGLTLREAAEICKTIRSEHESTKAGVSLMDAARFFNDHDEAAAGLDAETWRVNRLMRGVYCLGKCSDGESLYPRAEVARRVAEKIKVSDGQKAKFFRYLEKVERKTVGK